jgi:hypothetical protein
MFRTERRVQFAAMPHRRWAEATSKRGGWIPTAIRSRLISYVGYYQSHCRVCSFNQTSRSFPAYGVSIEEINNRSKKRCSELWKENMEHNNIAYGRTPRLRKTSRPPLLYPGATPDSTRAEQFRTELNTTTRERYLLKRCKRFSAHAFGCAETLTPIS